MPPKSSSTALPPRRTPRITARKSTIPPKPSPNSSSSKSSPAAHKFPETLTTTAATKESSPPSITSPKHKTTPNSSPKTTPLASSEAASNSFATKPSTKDVREEAQSVAVQSEAIPNMDSEITTQIGLDKTLVVKVSPAPETATIETEKTGQEGGAKTKTVVKKTVRIVKKVVKKKVPKRVQKDQIVSSNEVSEKLESPSNDGETPIHSVLGEVDAENSNSIESVIVEVENPKPVESFSMEVENPIPVESVWMEIENHKPAESVSMEVENISNTKDTVLVETENSKSSVIVSDAADVCEPNSSVAFSLEVEKPSFDVEKQKESEVCEVVKDASFTEVPGLGFVGAKNDEEEGEKTVSITKTQLEDENVDSPRDQNHECKIENNVDCKTGEGEREEVKKKVENSEIGGLKAEALLGEGVLLSGEMEALERRRRRKTEIFIGGLDKDTKEEDIRKIFEEVGEVKDVRLMINGKTRKNKGFAFVRYASAADAKKALAKYHKVEICGRQCGTSPVEGNDTLFLGNIDKKWKNENVVRLLEEIGIEKIDKVTVIADPNKIELNRGFAFLELETNKDAQYAYKKLQKKGVFGKHLKVKVAWAEPLIEPDEKEMLKVKSVYAEYLPSSWDEEKVKDCFKKFGEIENVLLAKDMPSSRRKDFAFVNYTTREAALACIEAFSCEQFNDEDSKVNVKVSLAKPIPKGQQMKHLRTPPSKELSKEKHNASQPVIKLHEGRNMGKATSSNYENIRVDQRSSTTSELVQLLREQASWRQTQPGLGRGSVNVEHSYPSPGRKRPFPMLGDDSHFSDPRGHPRARVEGSYPNATPSALTRGVDVTSLPHYHRQGAGYTSEPFYGVEDYPNYVQTREQAPYHGNSGIYRRY